MTATVRPRYDGVPVQTKAALKVHFDPRLRASQDSSFMTASEVAVDGGLAQL